MTKPKQRKGIKAWEIVISPRFSYFSDLIAIKNPYDKVMKVTAIILPSKGKK